MKYTSLASRYRPQTFADVAGQDMVKAVLSRAAQEDKVAPAYLFSGTRGVGKTTIARIFAKALNCAHAPAAEPCNTCEQCRKITQGVHVDVTEIDGASNNSVEDARALRETIGYAAMEGRYKVFIIDEAHMLSRSAFNALLKTLEEPPARVVFIFATTEAHKFPVTIVSRCQHFIFKHLPESALVAHLNKILQAEGMAFEAGAVNLIARRAAGSVRDAMSLLDQCLSLGGESLSQANARAVLGVAGQELFVALLDAFAAQDCAAITQLLRRLLDQGVDIGFFLRELATLWRTLFLLRQSGEKIVAVLDMPADECSLWLQHAPRFSLQHIHAAWQMVLDAQRRITHSPEPAAALELLLLHLALLPRLLPLEQVGDFANSTSPVQPSGAASPALPNAPAAPTPSPAPVAPTNAAVSAASAGSLPTKAGVHAAAGQTATSHCTEQANTQTCQHTDTKAEPAEQCPTAQAPAKQTAADTAHIAPSASAHNEQPAAPRARSWEHFCEFCASVQEQGGTSLPARMLRAVAGQFEAQSCRIQTPSQQQCDSLERSRPQLENLLARYCRETIAVTIVPPARAPRTEAQLKEEFLQRAEVKLCCELLDARLDRVHPLTKNP